ncbi:Ti-type conjugative transfer relaxase TraA [Sphingobium boeckii]|uniref:Ti-type conjugative transfer relaxase TraA n=1 Tax=Sphingobium boeckii TaxID=1082345 RepID=A0A7W9EH88_9SPHN|nr:Ti-type conjugative transfer relaxase TraA [Sphingobium boeckii]MBB5687860.1 Ti-type conjugative transfer relaxase TraA [Sphingobium boeckii]
MAIYHFSVKVISRAAGSSAVAAAAYRSASRLHDRRLDRGHDFSNKAGVVHSEVMLPEGAPERWQDRATLWNDVEAAEVRKDAQLAREIEFAIPRELTQEQGIALARDFVAQEFVANGMVADLNVHWDVGAGGEAKPHAHVMLGMREVSEDGFGPKVRDWNRTDLLQQWRERWEAHVNTRLAALDIDARIDRRSLEAQGIDLEPQNKIGPAGARRLERGENAERAVDHVEIARRNGARIALQPSVGVEAMTHQQATFTKRDMAMFAHRHSADHDQYDRVLGAMKASPELVELGTDGRGEARFTSRSMIESELRLQRFADGLEQRQGHAVPATALARGIAAAETRGLQLGGEQQAALHHIGTKTDIALVVGYAGTGKSTMLGLAREAWEEQGCTVRGATLSGISADNLESGSGIRSRTIASLEHQWGQGRDLLTSKDVLVIDEAGMIGARQMERIVAAVHKAEAKLVLIGDVQQLQAIEAGAPFRALAERHGAVEITEVRRQSEDWQRDATRQLATGRTGEALEAYDRAGMVHEHASRESARKALIEGWNRERQAEPEASRIILTHTRQECDELNALARDALRRDGTLVTDIAVKTVRGERLFCENDRIMFLRNERALGVKNGSAGTIEQVSKDHMRVTLDDGRGVAFDTKTYADIDHGYATTIHKAQGVTVDRVHVLATPGLDRHATYVALSRHTDSVHLHYGKDDFADRGKLVRTLARERAKDAALDYDTNAFAERRGIRVAIAQMLAAEKVPGWDQLELPVPEPAKIEIRRGMFDGLRLSVPGAPSLPRAPGMFAGIKLQPMPERASAEQSLPSVATQRRAIQIYAQSLLDAQRMIDRGLPVLEHQKSALARNELSLEQTRPHALADMREAFRQNRSLIQEAAAGRTDASIGAMAHEANVRTDPALRADRFVQRWNRMRKQLDAAEGRQRDGVGKAMNMMVDGLHRDPQLESLLRQRKQALGLMRDEDRVHPSRGLCGDLIDMIGHGRSRGLSL